MCGDIIDEQRPGGAEVGAQGGLWGAADGEGVHFGARVRHVLQLVHEVLYVLSIHRHICKQAALQALLANG